MVSRVNHRDAETAQELYELQQASYIVERDLIEYPDFPPLRVTPSDIRQTDEVFLASYDSNRMAGAVSFSITPDVLDICRMLVHPDFFRRGIATQLLLATESHARPGQEITVSTAERNVPAVKLYLKHGYSIAKRQVLPDGLVIVHFSKHIA